MANISYPLLGKVHSSSVGRSRTMHSTLLISESRPDMWTLRGKKRSVLGTPSYYVRFTVERYCCIPSLCGNIINENSRASMRLHSAGVIKLFVYIVFSPKVGKSRPGDWPVGSKRLYLGERAKRVMGLQNLVRTECILQLGCNVGWRWPTRHITAQ